MLFCSHLTSSLERRYQTSLNTTSTNLDALRDEKDLLKVHLADATVTREQTEVQNHDLLQQIEQVIYRNIHCEGDLAFSIVETALCIGEGFCRRNRASKRSTEARSE